MIKLNDSNLELEQIIRQNDMRGYYITIEFDSLDRLIETSAKFSINDFNTSMLTFQLMFKGKVIKLKEDTEVIAVVKQPSGTIQSQICKIVDLDLGIGYIKFNKALLDQIGINYLEIAIKNKDEISVLTSPKILFSVYDSLSNNNINDDTDEDVLPQEQVETLLSLMSKVSELNTNVTIAENIRINNENIRIQNEVARIKEFEEMKKETPIFNIGNVEQLKSDVAPYVTLEQNGNVVTLNFGIPTCGSVSNEPTEPDESTNSVFKNINTQLLKNGYKDAVQLIKNGVNTLNNEFIGKTIKLFTFIDGKFYYLNTINTNNDLTLNITSPGQYFITQDTDIIYDIDAMELIYNDEFNIASDLNNWVKELHESGWTNEELQEYVDSSNNSYILDDNLVIQGTYENGKYKSARLRSKKAFLYGKFDIVAKLPTGKGMWPAIWMMPESDCYGEWPKSGEIDIMENVGKEPQWIHGSLHSEKYNFKYGNQVTSKISIPTNYNEFHKYSVIWTPQYIKFLVDDDVYLTHSYDSEKDQIKWEAYPYDKPYNLLLNLAIGGNWGGEVDNTLFPVKFYIDSMKVYDLGFSKYDTIAPNNVEHIELSSDNVLTWYYTYDNIAVDHYAITLNNGKSFSSIYSYYAFSNIDLIGATEISVQAVDICGNMTNKETIIIRSKETTTVLQSNFSTLVGWDKYIDVNADTTITANNNKAIISILNGGTENWHIQFNHNGISITQGSYYECDVIIKSNVTRKITVAVQNKETYEPYFTITQTIIANTSTKLHMSYSHKGTTDIDANFIIFAGNELDENYGINTVEIENVSIVKFN